MKHLLLLIAVFFVFAANAQQHTSSVVFKEHPGISKTSRPVYTIPLNRDKLKQLSGNRTTSGPTFYYNYPDTILGNDSITTIDMWADTTGIFGHSFGYTGYSMPAGHYYFTSVGTLFDPMDSVWVPHGNWIPPSSGYTIDSVTVGGTYGRPAGATYTDSLKLTFVYGNGHATSNMPYNGFLDPTILATFGAASTDTVWFPVMFWDSLHNTATHAPMVSVAPVTLTFPLTATDTSLSFVKSYPINITIPAGNFTGMSLSFISGGSHVPFDTIQYMDGSFKYGCFRPAVSVGWGSGTWPYTPVAGPTYPAPVTRNFPPGFFKTEGVSDYGWTDEYVPWWAWALAGGSSSDYAQPYINFYAHSLASTEASLINKLSTVNVYPNPANDATTITFDLDNKANVSLSLTNVLGQVVYKQDMGSVDHCKTAVNTSALPAGVYFYIIAADGQRNNGQLIVAH